MSVGKKIEMLFTSLGRSILGETVPSVWVRPRAVLKTSGTYSFSQYRLPSRWITYIYPAMGSTGVRLIFFCREAFIGVRAEGTWGAAAPPKFWATQIFWAARENLGKARFQRRFVVFFCYFEEINILYFILTKILTSVGVIIKLHSLET